MPSPEADRLVHTDEEHEEMKKELARLEDFHAFMIEKCGPPITFEERVRELQRQIEAPA